jgi:hypothetical protein
MPKLLHIYSSWWNHLLLHSRSSFIVQSMYLRSVYEGSFNNGQHKRFYESFLELGPQWIRIKIIVSSSLSPIYSISMVPLCFNVVPFVSCFQPLHVMNKFLFNIFFILCDFVLDDHVSWLDSSLILFMLWFVVVIVQNGNSLVMMVFIPFTPTKKYL